MPKPDPARIRRTATAAVVFDEEGRVLLQHRSDNGNWGLPGGSMEIGETAEESIVREVLEETGYQVVVKRLVGIYSDPKTTTMHYPNGDVVAYVSLTFECVVVGGASALSDETQAVDWFLPTALPQPFQQNHETRVKDAITGQVAAFYR